MSSLISQFNHSFRRKSPFFAIPVGLGLSLIVCNVQSVQAANLNFSFLSDPHLTTATRPFTSGGVTLTVDNAIGNNITSALSTPNSIGVGGVNTDRRNGLCVALLSGTTGKCQYTSSALGDITFTGLTFTFNKPVRLLGFDFTRVGGIETGSLAFTSGGSNEIFSFSNPGGGQSANGGVFKSSIFATNFLVDANVPIAVSSAATVYASGSSGSIRINNLSVQEVPGPLPVFGVAAAFGWSRRLRSKLRATPGNSVEN